MSDLENKDQVSKVSITDVASAIGMELLKQARSHAVDHRATEIIQIARKWGANIPEDQESTFKNELKGAIGEPVSWPKLTIEASTQTVTSSKKPASNPKAGPKTSGLKAADFPALKAPEGRVITCPVKITSGPNPRDHCGKECKRTLFDHDPANKPECAAFECDHFFCGTHITKVHAASGNLAKSRLKSNTNAGNPVTMEGEDGKTSNINTDILNVKDDDKAQSASETLNKLFEMADDEDD